MWRPPSADDDGGLLLTHVLDSAHAGEVPQVLGNEPFVELHGLQLVVGLAEIVADLPQRVAELGEPVEELGRDRGVRCQDAKLDNRLIRHVSNLFLSVPRITSLIMSASSWQMYAPREKPNICGTIVSVLHRAQRGTDANGLTKMSSPTQ